MNAHPRTIYVEAEDWLLTLAKWHRQSEELLLSRLYGTATETLEVDDSAPDAGPSIPVADDEYAWASALGREE